MSNVSNNEFSLIWNLNLSRFKCFKSTKRTVYTVRLPVIKTIWCNFVAIKQTTCGISIKAAFRNLQRELWHVFPHNKIAIKSPRNLPKRRSPGRSLRAVYVLTVETLCSYQTKISYWNRRKMAVKRKKQFSRAISNPLKIAANVVTKIASWINLCKRPLTT